MKRKNKGQDGPQEYRYQTIDGRQFVQRRLVLGQMEQLVDVMRDVKWPSFDNFNLLSFYEAIGGKLPVALAVVLVESGKDLREKDVDSLADDLRYSMPLDEGVRALKDFFVLNPTASIARSLGDMQSIQGAIREVPRTTTPSPS